MFVVLVAVLNPNQAVATSKDGRHWPVIITGKFLKRMAGKSEQTFYATLVDGVIKLGHFASWQAWSESAT